MSEHYRHNGGSNRACDPEGNLIGWLVFTDASRTTVEVVDRDGQKLIIERVDDGFVVHTEAGEVRHPRPATSEDPFYLAVGDDGAAQVLVDREGNLCVPLEEFDRARGRW